MATIAEIEQQLLLFLRNAIPEFNLSTSPRSERDAGTRDPISQPVARVTLIEASPAQGLRWRLRLVDSDAVIQTDLDTPSPRTSAALSELRRLLADPLGDMPWKLFGGSLRQESNVAPYWEEIISAPWTPDARSSQVLISDLIEYITLGSSGVTSGQTSFVHSGTPGSSGAVGELIIINVGDHLQSLGAIVDPVPGPLISSRAVNETADAPVEILRVGDHVQASSAGAEIEDEDFADHRITHRTLTGDPQVDYIGVAASKLTLRWSSMSPAELTRWRSFLRDHIEQPTLLLIRADLSVVEVIVQGFTAHTSPDGSIGPVELRLTVSGSPSVARFVGGS